MNIAEQWHKRFQEAPLSKNAGYFWGLISAALAVFLSVRGISWWVASSVPMAVAFLLWNHYWDRELQKWEWVRIGPRYKELKQLREQSDVFVFFVSTIYFAWTCLGAVAL